MCIREQAFNLRSAEYIPQTIKMSFNDLPDAYKVLTILRFYKQPATLKNEIGGDRNGKTNIYITDIFGHAAGITRSDYALSLIHI